MRILMILLALLATGKVITLQWLHRSVSDDIIVSTWGPRALEACGRDARRVYGLDAGAWPPDTAVRLEIGRGSTAVKLWQVDDPAWNERYRKPYLRLVAGLPGQQVTCSYDMSKGTATTSKT